jgi:allantoate deiminase
MSRTTAQDVVGWCRRIAACSEVNGATTRTFLSTPMHDVHTALGTWMTEVGLQVHVDAAGNLRGTYPATRPDAPWLVIGSHLDTVPNAGAFDGILGVVLGVALVQCLDRRRLPYGLEVVGFSEEEGVRFGVPFIGSRAFIGTLDTELLARTDDAGIRVDDAIRHFGLNPDRVPAAAARGPFLGFLEFHIEQGPVLDRRHLPLGIVDAIVGQTRLEVTFTGQANHAGTTPMDARRDALAGAAEWTLAVEREARAVDGLVATVGRLDARPGATNVVAGLCRASLDVRHPDDRIRRAGVATLSALADRIAKPRGLVARTETTLEQPATAMDPALVAALAYAAAQVGAATCRMASGAGHDAMVLASRMPAAMLFLRTPGGISHHPDESVLVEDVATALEVGLSFLERLAETSAP